MLVPAERTHNRFAERLDAAHAAMILVDCQTGMIGGEPGGTANALNGILALACLAGAVGLPVLLASLSGETRGSILPALEPLVVSSRRSLREGGDCWQDPWTRAAIKAMGRRQLIFAGAIATMGEAPADAAADGYDAYVVADAVAGRSDGEARVGLARIRSPNVTSISWITVMSQLTAGDAVVAADHRSALEAHLREHRIAPALAAGDT